MQKLRPSVLTFLVLGLLGTACSNKSEFAPLNQDSLETSIPDPPKNNNNSNPDDDIEETILLCDEAEAAGTIRTEVQTVNYEPVMDCPWNENGNLSRVNQLLRARVERIREVALPRMARLCDVKLEFPVQDEMFYDDEIFLLFNDKVLFSSQNYSEKTIPYSSVGLKEDDAGIMTYAWSGDNGLLNLFYDHNVTGPFCYGVTGTEGFCQIPRSEHEGQFRFEIPQVKVLELAQSEGVLIGDELNGAMDPLRFNFVTTGDNDNHDCESSELRMVVEIKYIAAE